MAEQETAPSAPPASPPQPLFYSNVVPLSPEQHGSYTIQPEADFGFSRDTNSIPINAIEIRAASTEYPIVFTSTPPHLPVAVVGFREHRNLFVNDEGQWINGVYIPAYVRRYPFLFLSTGDEARPFILGMDASSKLLGTGEGNALFDGNAPTDLTNRALEFCKQFHEQALRTTPFIEALKEQDLLIERTISITPDPATTGSLAGGEQEQLQMGGFCLINEEKLSELRDEIILNWHRKGWLTMINWQIASLNNWGRLVALRRKALGN